MVYILIKILLQSEVQFFNLEHLSSFKKNYIKSIFAKHTFNLTYFYHNLLIKTTLKL